MLIPCVVGSPCPPSNPPIHIHENCGLLSWQNNSDYIYILIVLPKIPGTSRTYTQGTFLIPVKAVVASQCAHPCTKTRECLEQCCMECTTRAAAGWPVCMLSRSIYSDTGFLWLSYI